MGETSYPIVSGGGAPLGIIECRYAVNTNAGGASISADTWTALAITEFLDTGSHCSVAGGVMTLSSGTYRGFIECTQVAETGAFQSASLRLRNTSDSLTPIKTSLFNTTPVASLVTTVASSVGSFVISGSKNFQLEILYEITGTIGASNAASLNDPNENLLAKIYLEKIA